MLANHFISMFLKNHTKLLQTSAKIWAAYCTNSPWSSQYMMLPWSKLFLPCSSLPSLQRLELWPRLKLISSEVLAVSVSPTKLREIQDDIILKVKAVQVA